MADRRDHEGAVQVAVEPLARALRHEQAAVAGRALEEPFARIFGGAPAG